MNSSKQNTSMTHNRFTIAIVRKPGRSMIHGLTTANLGIPDYEKALFQHESYVRVLESCGLQVLTLEADEKYPDSTFIEDTALLTPKCAIITNPGALSRKGEISEMAEILKQFYPETERIVDPGTVDGGDILMAGTHFYIGLSSRTNETGAEQILGILNRYGYTASLVKPGNMLHLKTGIAYLGENTMVVAGELFNHPDFMEYKRIGIPDHEKYAANCIRINHTVIIPAGFPMTRQKISAAGFTVTETDVSEFRKLDGGLSCLSLRF